jgi:arylsulfatase A-like enzyme
VIITSDHGEHLGERSLVGHGMSLYMPLLRVPLLMRLPERVPAGARVGEWVTLRDLPATVMSLIVAPDDETFPGSSLARFWREPDGSDRPSPILSEVSNTPSRAAWWPTSRGRMKSIIVGNHQYIWSSEGREELYDLENDPDQVRDLVGTEQGDATLLPFRKALEEALAGGAAR